MLLGLLDAPALVFSAASMLSVGLGTTVQELIGRLGNGNRIARALIANFVLVPLLACAIAHLLALDPPLRTGLMLLGMAAGAPFVIKLSEVAGQDVGTAGTLLVLLLPSTVLYLPLVAPLVLPNVTVTVTAIAIPLLLSMLLPLMLGLLARAWLPRSALRLQPMMGAIATVALIVLVFFTFILNLPQIIALFGTGAILAAALSVAGAFAIGFLVGGRTGGYGSRNGPAQHRGGNDPCHAKHRCPRHPVHGRRNSPHRHGRSISDLLASGKKCRGAGLGSVRFEANRERLTAASGDQFHGRDQGWKATRSTKLPHFVHGPVAGPHGSSRGRPLSSDGAPGSTGCQL